jgi:hypothetical protein
MQMTSAVLAALLSSEYTQNRPFHFIFNGKKKTSKEEENKNWSIN